MAAETTDPLRVEAEPRTEHGNLLTHLRERANIIGSAALHDEVLTRQDLVDAIEPF
jgi:hypothetical protein